MAAEMVNQATSEKLKEMNWMKNIEICELVTRDPGKAKDVIKSIKKRLKNKHANSQLFAVMLLEMLMNNCGEHVYRQVIDTAVLPILVKIVKKKTDLPVRGKIFLLLDATQTALGGASGRFPQYYNAYCELVSSGVQFPQHGHVTTPKKPDPRVPMESMLTDNLQKHENGGNEATAQLIFNSSIIEKASSILEVLRDALNALGSKHPEGAMDEFILDLVEQCSFQKQKIMHLVMTSRDEKVVTEAIDLNDQLHQVLSRHDALLSIHPTTATNFSKNEEEEEEEEDAERLYRRLCKGKACVKDDSEQLVGSLRSIPQEKMRRPLIRPLPSDHDGKPRPLIIQPSDPESGKHGFSIPSPPAKHMEREIFFRDKGVDGLGLAVHVRGLSLHSSDGSSSGSGSTDFRD